MAQKLAEMEWEKNSKPDETENLGKEEVNMKKDGEEEIEKFVIHYHEIALKGGNRPIFEKKLIENIMKKIDVLSWKKDMARIVIEVKKSENAEVKLAKIFGIAKFAKVKEIEKSMEKLKEEFSKSIEKLPKDKTLKVRVKRADKTFPFTSQEIEKELGKIAVQNGFKIDLKNPDNEFFVEIAGKIYLYSSYEQKNGPGGLPVSTGGKALCLLSGGIDSPVASFLVMKRGMHTDFIHFHAFPNNSDVLETKITELVGKLFEYLPNPVKVFLVPYYHFQIRFSAFMKYELVLFKRFMMKVSEKIAEMFGYSALVTGESLGQVASQTIDNLRTIYHNLGILTFHPLIGFDKNEITELAKKIGTYEISIKDYKDCCSIVSRHPATKTKPEIIEKIEKEKGMEEVVQKTLEDVEFFIFPSDGKVIPIYKREK